ncbi:unnamed protein product [Urochloa decumbens]|uniref:Uncharacterized protein n=1 Tax=Urochloa decumbens TaxID=240449 RepID=A0ABC9E773_9POAL
MDKGKKPVDPIRSEEEMRMLKAMCDLETITKQYMTLLVKMIEWRSDGVVSVSDLQASVTELSDNIRRFQRELYWDNEASTSGSGLTEQEPVASPADPKPEPPSP